MSVITSPPETKAQLSKNYKIETGPCDEKHCVQLIKFDDFMTYTTFINCFCDSYELEATRLHNQLYDLLNGPKPTLEEIHVLDDKLKKKFPGKSLFRQPTTWPVTSYENFNFFGKNGLIQKLTTLGIPSYHKGLTDKTFIENFYDIFYIRDLYQFLYPDRVPCKKYPDFVYDDMELIYDSQSEYW